MPTGLQYLQNQPRQSSGADDVQAFVITSLVRLRGFYNTRRRHSRLGNLSPTDCETMHLTQNEVSA